MKTHAFRQLLPVPQHPFLVIFFFQNTHIQNTEGNSLKVLRYYMQDMKHITDQKIKPSGEVQGYTTLLYPESDSDTCKMMLFFELDSNDHA